MEEHGTRFWFFISHSGGQADRREAGRFVAGLRRFVVPAALRGSSTRGGALPARLWPVVDGDGGAVDGALARSRFLVVVCSREAARHEGVRSQVEEFLRLGGAERIFCLVVDGEPNAADSSRECLPVPLRRSVCGREILAADPRNEGDGRREAMLKIVAGATGLDYGRLAGRERSRAMVRLASWFAFAVSLAAAAGGLAWQAERGRVRAEREVRRANLTSDYLASVLAQLMPFHGDGIPAAALRPLVDSPVMAGVEEALQGAPMALFKVRNTLGDVYYGTGRIDEALEAFQANLVLGEELFGTESHEYSVTRLNLAKAMHGAGRFEEAIRLIDENVAFYQRQGYSPVISSILIALGNKSLALRNLGRTEESVELNRWIYESIAPVDDIPSINAAPLKNNYAMDLLAAGDYRGSVAVLEEVVADLIEEHGENHNRVAFYLAALAQSCLMLHEQDPGRGTLERTLEVSRQALERTTTVYGKENQVTLYAVKTRVRVLMNVGLARKAMAIFHEYFGNPPDVEKLRRGGFTDGFTQQVLMRGMQFSFPESQEAP